MTSPVRHFGTIRGGEEVLIAGYNKGQNACFVVRLTHLPQDESAALRQIAMSVTAQNLDFLIPTLRVELHKSGQDWFTHLATRLYRNDGAVLSLPLKEIETMNEQQKAFFKGYGAAVEPEGGPSSRVGSDQEFRTPLTDAAGDVVVAEPISEAQAPANLEQARAAGLAPTPSTDPEMARAAAQAAPPPAQNDAMLAVLAQLAEGQQQMAASLDKLADKVKAPPRRKTTRKKTTAKKPAATSAA